MFSSLLLAVLLLFSIASPLRSQTSLERFNVSGTVTDQNGAVIVGARVELRQGGVVLRTSTTDATGSFRFVGVAQGDYQIQAVSEGFDSSLTEIKVGSQSLKSLQIVLTVAAIRLDATVTANDSRISTESSNNQNAVALSFDTLSSLPVFDQDYVSALSRFLEPDSTATSGVTLIVNGVEANGVNVSPSAIKELKINQDPYSAEFPRPGQGHIEVVTKPGEQKFHGTFNFTFRDARLNARDPFALVRPPEQRRIYEGVFTGPVRRSKKTSFMLSLERSEEDLQAVVFARVLAGILQESVATRARDLLVAGQIDHAVNQKNNFSIRYSFEDKPLRNQGVGGNVLPEAGTDSRFTEHVINISHDFVFSPKAVNQFRLLLGHFNWLTSSVTHDAKIIVLDAFTGGGAQNDQLHTEYHFELTDIFSYSAGRHLIKTGINVPDWSRRGTDFNVNSGGTFYFSNLQDFILHRPFTFTVQQGDSHLVFVEKVVGGFVQEEYRLRSNLLFTFGLRYDWQNYFQDSNNFAPRASFAYSPRRNQKTVIRGGAGVFYDRTCPRPMLDILLFNGRKLRQYVVENPVFTSPSSVAPSLASQPVSLVRLEPNIHIPYLFQYGIGIERQLRKSTSVGVNYIGASGVGLFRSRDANAPLPPDYSARPDPTLGLLREIEAAGRSRRDSLEISLRGNVKRYFKGMAQYRLSRTYNNTGGINYFPPNSYDLSGEWARASDDRRHRLDILGTINPGKLFNLGVALALYSGAPYTITTGLDDFHTGMANARPAGVARNSMEGPAYADLDLRWSRDIFIVKRKGEKGPTLTFAVDAFNVLNHVNFTSFVGNLSSTFFGQAVAAQPTRRLQLSARFKF